MSADVGRDEIYFSFAEMLTHRGWMRFEVLLLFPIQHNLEILCDRPNGRRLPGYLKIPLKDHD